VYFAPKGGYVLRIYKWVGALGVYLGVYEMRTQKLIIMHLCQSDYVYCTSAVVEESLRYRISDVFLEIERVSCPDLLVKNTRSNTWLLRSNVRVQNRKRETPKAMSGGLYIRPD
jgi:hypothetical protein